MSVDEETWERYLGRWDELPRHVAHTCATCFNNGCCEYSCGGLNWTPYSDGEEPEEDIEPEGGE